MSDRDERIETYYHQSAWDLAERVVDLEDGIKTFMELDDLRLKEIEKLKADLSSVTLERDSLQEVYDQDWDW